MTKEIERKYLISESRKNYFYKNFLLIYKSVNSLLKDVKTNGKEINQGYLERDSGLEIINELGLKNYPSFNEFRIRNKSGIYFLTLKSPGKLSRDELNVKISEDLFEKFWPKTESKRIRKLRIEKMFEEHKVEFDVYLDRELIIAEVEFRNKKDSLKFKKIGKEITYNKNYKNFNLSK